jgi:hypothetical protein
LVLSVILVSVELQDVILLHVMAPMVLLAFIDAVIDRALQSQETDNMV